MRTALASLAMLCAGPLAAATQLPLAEPTPSVAPPTLVASMRGEVPSLQLQMAPRTRLVYEPKPSEAAAAHAILPLAEPEHRLGLEFDGGGRRGGPRNLLRVQMSSTSALHFRPRGGGLAVSWRSQF